MCICQHLYSLLGPYLHRPVCSQINFSKCGFTNNKCKMLLINCGEPHAGFGSFYFNWFDLFFWNTLFENSLLPAEECINFTEGDIYLL
jgi:hypothetical protein